MVRSINFANTKRNPSTVSVNSRALQPTAAEEKWPNDCRSDAAASIFDGTNFTMEIAIKQFSHSGCSRSAIKHSSAEHNKAQRRRPSTHAPFSPEAFAQVLSGFSFYGKASAQRLSIFPLATCRSGRRARKHRKTIQCLLCSVERMPFSICTAAERTGKWLRHSCVAERRWVISRRTISASVTNGNSSRAVRPRRSWPNQVLIFLVCGFCDVCECVRNEQRMMNER